MLEHPGGGTGKHQPVPGGNHPAAGGKIAPFRYALQRGFRIQEAKFAGGILEERKRHEPEPGGDKAAVRIAWVPQNLVNSKTFSDGIHHLAGEQFEAAFFAGINGMLTFQITIKVFQGSNMLFCQGIRGRVQVTSRENCPAMARDGFFSFGNDRAEEIIPLLQSFPDIGRFAEEAAFEAIKSTTESIGLEMGERVETEAFVALG